jgi:hypothetical protein
MSSTRKATSTYIFARALSSLVFEGLSLLHANSAVFRAYTSAHMFSLSCRWCACVGRLLGSILKRNDGPSRLARILILLSSVAQPHFPRPPAPVAEPHFPRPPAPLQLAPHAPCARACMSTAVGVRIPRSPSPPNSPSDAPLLRPDAAIDTARIWGCAIRPPLRASAMLRFTGRHP